LTWRQKSDSDMVAILLHETTHAVTRAYLGSAPIWFMEGSAELIGTPAAGRFKLRRQDEAQRWKTLLKLLENQQMPSLRPFLSAGSYKEWNTLFAGRVDYAYTASYSLFHFFIAYPQATLFLTRMIDSQVMFHSGDPNKVFADYVDQNWPGGLALFEKGWHAWIRQQAAKIQPDALTGRGSPAKLQ
jgi:hypothetical protein